MDPSSLILVARVAGAFGVRGEVRITAFTEDPMALLDYGVLRRADGLPGLTLITARPAKGGVVARTRELTTPEQADALRGLELFIDRGILPEPDEDEFYLADLIGLQARDLSGQAVGMIKAVQNFGAGDLLEIQPTAGGPTWWLAFTRETAPEVKITEGHVVIVPPAEIEADPDERP
jgi:16S rRNA processing protein RimM